MSASTASWHKWFGLRSSILVAMLAAAMTTHLQYGFVSIPEFARTLVANFSASVLLSLSSSSRSKTTVWTITPNSTGLKVDAAIFERYLGSQMSMLADPPPPGSINHDKCVYLFLEVTPSTPNAAMHPDWPHAIKTTQCRVMAMVNTDQFTSELLDTPQLELLLCKSHQCTQWLQQQQQQSRPTKTQIPILYSGFTSIEPLQASTTNTANTDGNNNDDTSVQLAHFDRFLHVAGSSPHKGTSNIMQAWLQHPHWPRLTITSHNNQLLDILLPQIKQQLGISNLPPNIRHISKKMSRQELSNLMTTHGVHLCLSGMEGFGHYMNEARAVGALVVATNYPPMNEMITEATGILIDSSNMLEWTNTLPFANVGPPQIMDVMNNVLLPMSLQERAAKGQHARIAFEEDRRHFQHRMEQLACYIQDRRPSENVDKTTPGECAKQFALELE